MSSHGASVRKRPSAARLSILYHLPANRTPRRVPLNPRGTSGRSSSFFTPVVAPSQGTGGAHPNMVRITALAIVPPHTAKYAWSPPFIGRCAIGAAFPSPYTRCACPYGPSSSTPPALRVNESAASKSPSAPSDYRRRDKGKGYIQVYSRVRRGPFRLYSYVYTWL